VIGGFMLAAALLGWAVLMLVDQGAVALLPAGIAVAMALFVVVGVMGERGSDEAAPTTWPVGIPLTSVARPVVRLATDTPVREALSAGGDAAVILTQADGVARGVLDEAAARSLAIRDPEAPAALVARPIQPAAVVFAGDDPEDVLRRVRVSVVDPFVLVDDDGLPIGVIRAADLLAVARRAIGRNDG
jgi:hypothetical protein